MLVNIGNYENIRAEVEYDFGENQRYATVEDATRAVDQELAAHVLRAKGQDDAAFADTMMRKSEVRQLQLDTLERYGLQGAMADIE